MIPLSTAISSGLTWRKIPHSRNYELVLNGEVVGTLMRPSVWSCKFLAETRDGRWTFRRGGFLGSGAEIVDSAEQDSAEQQIATFKANWGGGGMLTFTDGQTFHVWSKGWWRPVWSVMTQSEQLVFQLHRREKTVEVAPGLTLPAGRLSLLLMFVWYRVLQSEEDAAAVAVMAAS
jgi:hypothetical protein